MTEGGASLTVAAALRLARDRGLDRLDAQLIVAHVAGVDRTWVIAHADAPVDADRVAALVTRRAAGEPLAHLTGRREFHGLTLRITADVLDPRPDTETLVDWALELLRPIASPRVVDLGTGSGAIALALRHVYPRAEVHATDISTAALALARQNGAALDLAVDWHAGDWWDAVPGQAFDLAVSNPPYVAPGDPHLPALRHEPLSALVPLADRGDGLADLERIVTGASGHLVHGGWLLLEHGASQAPAVQALLAAAGFEAVATRRDLAGRPRVSGGRRGE